MNQVFNNSEPAVKLSILEFLKEESMSIHLTFKKENHGYFKDKYPGLYKNLLLGADGEIHLLAWPMFVDRKINTVRLIVLSFNTGDAEARYDDSSVQKITNQSYPSGIEMDIPLYLIEGITYFRVFRSE